MAMEGLLKEGAEIIEEGGDPNAVDAALISAAQKVEHYEMAGYGCARTYARLLGHSDHAATLQITLNEEGATDKILTKIALRTNVKAIGTGAMSGGSKGGSKGAAKGGTKGGTRGGSKGR
jgi:ferritin-like metal-binding protein YciE